MSDFRGKLQPAVWQETKKVAGGTAAGVILMWAVFGILHAIMPERVPFDYTVFLGGIGGGVVASLNFLWLGMTVQKAVAAAGDDEAAMRLRMSYTWRMLFQVIWGILSITVPCFQFVAGLLPLLFPSVVIKIMGILKPTGARKQ